VVAVGVRDKPGAKASKRQVGKNGKSEEPKARTNAKPKKTPNKPTPKNGTSTIAEKCGAAKRVRIRTSDAVGLGDAGKTIRPELDPFEIAKQKMKGSVPAIVEAMVELAKQGSCSHAKTLLEMTGAKHMFDGQAEVQDGGESWARLVLERLDEAESAAAVEFESSQEGARELVTERS
jgi:hypothetical protein